MTWPQIQRTDDGITFRQGGREEMPRIPDAAVRCCVFLFASEDEAEKGIPLGGSGFLVGTTWETVETHRHIYVVTNRHVARGQRGSMPCNFVRLNKPNGTTGCVEIDPSEWRSPNSGDDFAVALIRFYEQYDWTFEPVDKIVDEQIIGDYDLGPGDDVFSPGRFLDADGSKTNRPVIRFGNVALMPEVAIQTGLGNLQDSYLVEMRSRTGFSGSPVFIYLPPHASTWAKRKVPIDGRLSYGPWILGIHWGQLPVVGPDAFDIERRVPVSYGSGMSAVVPGERIKRFITEDGYLIAQRKKREAEWAEHSRPATMESAQRATDAADTEANPAHRADFKTLAGAAARKKPQGD